MNVMRSPLGEGEDLILFPITQEREEFLPSPPKEGEGEGEGDRDTLKTERTGRR